MRGLRLALGFITILPVRPEGELKPGDLGRAAVWFPVIGLVLGLVLWASDDLLNGWFRAGMSAALIVGLWVLLTGALHLDGFADCCDGLLSSANPERRLKILRDPHIGAFGVVGLILLLLLKWVAITELIDPRALVLAPMIGRWAVLPLARMHPARPNGLGARLHSELKSTALLIGLPVLALGIALGPRGWLALLLAHLSLLGIWLLARSRIGGQTGDVLGAGAELAELSVLLAFVGGAN